LVSLSLLFFFQWFIFKKPLLISSAQVRQPHVLIITYKVQKALPACMNVYVHVMVQASYFGSFLNVVGKSYNGQNNRPVQPVLDTTQIYSYGK
jgi:hypothetical protein